MLKRNARKFLKYLFFASLLIIGAVVLLKSFISVNDIDLNNIKSQAKYSGLPKAPNKNKISTSNEKIDWHNYTQIAIEKSRKGPGEQGAAFYLPPGTEKRKDELYKVNGFNGLASDYIAINRSIADIRHKDCAKKIYVKKLPTASIVVPFHNEHLSTLLRTATSVINRAPPELIKEVILVDDFSTKGKN
ncbi:putative polypeptide N-acetylgalactosaminyltransferase 10 [Trichonephila clavipes]|nr:putative polypeptide N-acetylgalactosaminyltransferase 10 [Trichonephila clavipes]